MCNIETTRKSLNLESSNNTQQVEAVEILETLLNMVVRVKKFHYLQTLAGDVEKAGS